MEPTLTLVVDRRTRAVLVGGDKSSYAAINVGKDQKSRVPSCDRALRLDTSVQGRSLTALPSVQGYMKPG